ncbi:hypothetical protein ACNUCX_16185 [Curtobacterium flaccumfaciens pv. flaccumfaciens]|uniref:hypothetical protein n=1 Tax=Curtobacterium flaccumfaciens TaxID=2035 RepID=UPI003AB187B8
MYENSGASALGGLIGIIIVTIVSLVVLYAIIRAAVVQGMNAHYKTVRRYEETGEWRYITDGKSRPHERDN